MLDPAVLVVLALATYRATRLFTADSLTLGWRNRIYRWAWDDEHPTVETVDGEQVYVPTSRGPLRSYGYELATCSWCLGVWAAAVLYVLWVYTGSLAVHAGIVILALAGAQGFVASRRDA